MNATAQNNTYPSSGNVGIGTMSPINIFQVSSLSDGVAPANWIAGNFGGQFGPRVVMGVVYGTATIGAHNNNLTAWTNLSINPDGGNVGIGTRLPGERLSVNGNIRAKEIKVETTGWPDFVFHKNFTLPRLEQTEKYILANGHLEGIPSTVEVEVNGLSLGEMNKKLLQKVEEITLYLIAQNKELLKQQKLQALQSLQLSQQNVEIEKLKTLLGYVKVKK